MQQELQGPLRCHRSKQWLEWIEKAQEVIRTRRFRVAVVGEFKRGKSSFINGLLGQRVLPVDTAPTTAIVSRITYGNFPRAYLYYKQGEKREVGIESLADYVTKLTEESKENAAGIQEAVIEYPSVFCQNYVDLIDTPGMNDDDAMNGRTVSYLDQIDLAIVAISANYPFSETECSFMVQLLENPEVSQIVVVVTYMDMVRERDRERVLSFLKKRIQETVLERLKKYYSDEDPIMQKYERIFGGLYQFGVSCVEAMEAHKSGNYALLESSGFVRLNNELPRLILSSQNINALQKAMNIISRVAGEYGKELPEMVKSCGVTVGHLREFRQNYERISREQLVLLAKQIKNRMSRRIEWFGQDMESRLSGSFESYFILVDSVDGRSFREAAGQCRETYKEITRVIREKLEPDLLNIYEEETIQAMRRFCAETTASLSVFAGYFDRQQEEFQRFSEEWKAPEVRECDIPFGWIDAFLPGQRGTLEAKKLAARARMILAKSLRYYCEARQKEVSALCRKTCQKIYGDMGKIGSELVREAAKYEAQLAGTSGKAYGRQTISRLKEIDRGNKELQRQFQSELSLE